MMEVEALEIRFAELRQMVARVREAIGQVIVGQADVVDGVLLCLMGDGHVLLEGVPGLGKTMLVKALSQTLSLRFARIQFTPDLMPADIVGTNLIVEDAGSKRFQFQRGPVFTNLLLADEINRATPKTQSALLEAMQERTVTAGGVTYLLDAPFCTLATQNPIEMEGTYPLPEAQLDRFLFKIVVRYPSEAELAAILDRTTGEQAPAPGKVLDAQTVRDLQAHTRKVILAPHIQAVVTKMVMATHPETPTAPEAVKKYVRYGASPRGGQAMIVTAKANALLNGRFNVSIEDLVKVAKSALRHRILLNFEGEAEGISTDAILDQVLTAVQEPVPAS